VIVTRWGAASAALRAVREQVFVREQGISPRLEWDGRDGECVHALARDSKSCPIGVARLAPDGRIGRMAVLRGWRGHGVGRTLLEALLAHASRHSYPAPYLNAQLEVRGFYRRCGFVEVGDQFVEAGIPHQRMVYSPE
jgi:predicted GNAT family N-acyltransferase